MARGNLKRQGRERLKSTVWGGAWGVIVGGVIVALASQLSVRHDLVLPQPEARAVETPAGTEFAQERPQTDPALPAGETVPGADVTAVTPADPTPADTSPMLDTAPAAAPAPAFAAPTAPGRPSVPRSAGVELTNRAGLRPETAGAPEARAPLPPGADRPAAISRDVPAPPVREAAPEVAEAADPVAPPEGSPVVEAPSFETPPVEAPASEIATLASPVEEAAPLVPASPSATASVAAAESPALDITPEIAIVTGEAPAVPVVDASPEVAPPAVASLAADPEPPAPATETASDAAPARVVPAPAAPVEAPAAAPALARAAAPAPAEPETSTRAGVALVGTEPAPSATERPAFVAPTSPESGPLLPEAPSVAGVEAPLPRRIEAPQAETLRIAQTPGAESEMPAVPSASVGERVGSLAGDPVGPVASPDPAEAAVSAEGGALVAHARAFEAEPGRARLAVVLLHESAAPPDPASLASLPPDVSFAVDGGSANAAAIARAYRAAGREVVLVPSIPAGATPQDVEVALAANFAAVSEAVAVMDTGETGFQNDRATVGQVIAVIADTGHGLITAPRGLNTAQQIAGRFDVPAMLIFDNLGAGGDAGAVSRALDRAAFRARQEAGVVIVGRAEPATIEGLGDWLRGRNAQSLALAPVSAVLAPAGASSAGTAPEAPANGLPRVRSLPGSQSN